MRTMVLVYLPTKLRDFVRAILGKYSSTMEHLGMAFPVNLDFYRGFPISVFESSTGTQVALNVFVADREQSVAIHAALTASRNILL